MMQMVRGVVMAVMMVVVMRSLVGLSDAAVHKVGDTAGWTTIGNVDYKQWAASKNFQLGDIIVFKYNSQFHNVMRVTHPMYRACNGSTPLAAFTTGNDSITLTNHGHHFFFCGVPGHCQAGQKVDINVLRTTSVSSASQPPSSPSSSPSIGSPTVPAVTSPGSSPSHAASANPMSVLAVFIASLVIALQHALL